jgi:hypothetical protein
MLFMLHLRVVNDAKGMPPTEKAGLTRSSR